MITKKIYFYLNNETNRRFPSHIDDCWDWLINTEGLGWLGKYHWILQPYLLLKKSDALGILKEKGYECLITNKLPKKGILITHPDCLPKCILPNKDLLIIITLVDRNINNYPNGNLYIVHNPDQVKNLNKPAYFIPPIPQINLFPRDKRRGEKFENISFFGYSKQLSDKFKEDFFLKEIKKLKLKFNIVPQEKWNDFSDVDAILAIRSFDNSKLNQSNKPFLKLINVWFAGVPAILGNEQAYKIIGEKGEDYLEANSIEEVIINLKKLRENPDIRKKLVERGKNNSKNYTFEKIVKEWESFLIDIAIPNYE